LRILTLLSHFPCLLSLSLHDTKGDQGSAREGRKGEKETGDRRGELHVKWGREDG